MPSSPSMRSQALAGNKAAFFAFLSALLAAAIFASDLTLINRSSAPSHAETAAILALQGLSALSALVALALGGRALMVGPTIQARLVGGLAGALAFVALLAWLPALFGIGL